MKSRVATPTEAIRAKMSQPNHVEIAELTQLPITFLFTAMRRMKKIMIGAMSPFKTAEYMSAFMGSSPMKLSAMPANMESMMMP